MKVDAMGFVDCSVWCRKVVSVTRLRELPCLQIGTIRRVGTFPDTFNVDRACGFRQGVAKPELERKVERQLLSQALVKKQPIRPIPDRAGGSESIPSHVFSTGKRLRGVEHELSTTHAHKNGNGLALCWGYNSYNGRRLGSNS